MDNKDFLHVNRDDNRYFESSNYQTYDMDEIFVMLKEYFHIFYRDQYYLFLYLLDNTYYKDRFRF